MFLATMLFHDKLHEVKFIAHDIRFIARYRFSSRYIVSSVDGIPRLREFYTMMSFLGCIGYFMLCSGLTEILTLIYELKSGEEILTGHAYAGVVRGHPLALASFLFAEISSTRKLFLKSANLSVQELNKSSLLKVFSKNWRMNC